MSFDSYRIQRHVKLLVPAAFAVVSIHSNFKESWRQAGAKPVVKTIAESLSHMMKNMLYRPHLVWEKGRKKKNKVKRCQGKIIFIYWIANNFQATNAEYHYSNSWMLLRSFLLRISNKYGSVTALKKWPNQKFKP
jgi:hypothetical protein